MNILIVRLGALGDIVHTIPAAAALRQAFPDARIDWIVDEKHHEILQLVEGIDRLILLRRPAVRGWTHAITALRTGRYDVALDFQGLMKSAVLARASGAARVLGFSIWHLREKGARPFYSESIETGAGQPGEVLHIIQKNLRLLSALGIQQPQAVFPLAQGPSAARDAMRAEAGGRPIALVNPGAAWPNKRWYTDRFGELAAFLHDVRGMTPFVLWGPGEEVLAERVIESSQGVARMAPATRITDLVEICRDAAIMVSGDTGPLHIAAAVGTPTVSIFGPTDPARNGPWSADDVAVSRFSTCGCHYDRKCTQAEWCLTTVPLVEVTAAVQRRLQR
jgi:heptosyltransferase-1